jgi:hypothetical protein
MSYLETPRLAFSGNFEADVSTVNNDVRHYDAATFEPRFQDMQTVNAAGQTVMNGWWNPEGTGAFRLIGVQVSGTETPGHPQNDAATGLFLNPQVERSAAKLVDLDPQFQMGSMIWGLQVVLTDGHSEYMRGDFRPAAFRDLFFGRISGVRGSRGASAKFTSILENVTWKTGALRSPTLEALRVSANANRDRLSINLAVFAYETRSADASFALGRVAGTIGPWRWGEPESFALGRRFAPNNGNNPFATPDGFGAFDAIIHEQAYLDLANSLPLADRLGAVKDVGALSLVVLKASDEITDNGSGPTVTPGVKEGAVVTPDEYIQIGEIDYREPDWLKNTAGVVTLTMPPDAIPAAGERPLALVARDEVTGQRRIVIRETYGGLFLRADDFEQRIDSRLDTVVGATARIYAVHYGARAARSEILAVLGRPEDGEGGTDSTPVDQPQADIPTIGVPQEAVRIPATIHTGDDGVAILPIHVFNPGNPRGYVDGQIYKISYGFAIAGQTPPPLFDQILLHVRDAFTVPASPTWDPDIVGVLRQFGNLYPIMSKGLFNLSDAATVQANARLLHFAFTRPIEDPNHMPVTRDLSQAKREMIVAWLATFFETPTRVAETASSVRELPASDVPTVAPVPAARTLTPEAAVHLASLIGEENVGKSAALRSYLDSHRAGPA